MSEPMQNPKPPKRSKRKPAMEPLGWDEIVSQPGMGGYLAFLNGPVPLPHLQNPNPGVESATEGVATPGETQPVVAPEVVSIPGEIEPGYSDPQIVTAPEVHSAPVAVSPIAPEVASTPVSTVTPDLASIAEVGETRRSESETGPGVESTFSVPAPEVVSIPAVLPGQRLRIRRCFASHDGHSLGEEVLYQALWKAASPESTETRTLVIGWRGMSQLCRMTPKNCKINTQRLIRKLALEVLSPYNTPESIGTSYRVYSDQAILNRRREAKLEWVIRSRGVEFVDPRTGHPVTAHLCTYVQN